MAIYSTALSDADAKALTQHFMDMYGIRPRQIYVDAAAGSDTNDGLSQSTAKATAAAGAALVRSGVGDHCLFKRGTAATLGAPITALNGFSSDWPTRYGSYGTTGVRPVLQFRNALNSNSALACDGFARTGAESKYIALTGLDLYSFERDPDDGAFVGAANVLNSAAGVSLLTTDIRWIWVEDCAVRFFQYNISLDAHHETDPTSGDELFIRRNIVSHAYNSRSNVGDNRAQGVYIQVPGTTRVLIEENAWHFNGWSDHPDLNDPNATYRAEPNIYSHNMYLAFGELSTEEASLGFVVRGNLSTYAASNGVQLRPGGVIDANLFYRNAIHAFTSVDDFGRGSPSLVVRSVFFEGRDLLGQVQAGGRNFGYQFNGGVDTLCAECIFSMPDPTGHDTGRAIELARGTGSEHYYARNNTVRLADSRALYCNESATSFAEVRIDRQLYVQTDTNVGARIADWEPTSFAGANLLDNYYYSAGQDTSGNPQWFRHDGTALTCAAWQTASGDTSTCASTAPTFVDATRDMGAYNSAIFAGANDADELIGRFLARGPGVWQTDLTAAAAIDWIRAGYEPTSLGYPSGGGYYGAVEY